MTAISEIATNEVVPIINNDEEVEEEMKTATKSKNTLTRVLAAACVLCVIFLASMNSSGAQPADVEGRQLVPKKRCDYPDDRKGNFCCCEKDEDCPGGQVCCEDEDRRLSEEDEFMAAIRGERRLRRLQGDPGACQYC